MKLKVQYEGMRIGGWMKEGETVMELPDTGFIDQYRQFCKNMGQIADENNFMDIRETGMEEINED